MLATCCCTDLTVAPKDQRPQVGESWRGRAGCWCWTEERWFTASSRQLLRQAASSQQALICTIFSFSPVELQNITVVFCLLKLAKTIKTVLIWIWTILCWRCWIIWNYRDIKHKLDWIGKNSFSSNRAVLMLLMYDLFSQAALTLSVFQMIKIKFNQPSQLLLSVDV